jgi:hypothetical protein
MKRTAIMPFISECLVSGHAFSRADRALSSRGLQLLRSFLQGLKPRPLRGCDGTTESRALIQRGGIRKIGVQFAATILLGLATSAHAADLKLPASVAAGQGLSISAHGSGEGTLYVSGPGTAIKRKVRLDQQIRLSGDELKNAGLYLIAVDGAGSGSFYVTTAPVGSIAFLARPSRVPADTHDVISGTAFLFDKYQNLVMSPQPVKFELSVNGENVTRTETSKAGVAYTKLDSSKREGSAHFSASSGPASVQRVVREVASDPCNIHMRAQPAKDGILVQTDPIHDCAGNPVPDGTIVTFVSTGSRGKSTVDARIKRGTAQAVLPPSTDATLSVASGVVVGNEIQWRGGL